MDEYITLEAIEPAAHLILAIVLHLFFRLTYLFYIGFRLREAYSNRPSNDDERYAKWLAFKKRASFILNADGVTLAFVIALSLDSITASASDIYLRIIGAGMILIGVGTKMSAYRIIGTRGYYWYNFFCNDGEREYVAKGIYKYLNNPMYGPGYLHVFGFPLLFLSSWGLVLAIFDWIVVWAFHFFFEHPHTVQYRRGG